MMKTKLAKAISLTIAGAALSVATTAASAHVMYNKNLAADQVAGTDGWVYGFNGSLPQGTRGGTYASPITSVNFSGTGVSTNTPFGYQGSSHLNWAAALHHPGSTLTVSEAHASSIGVTAEIDTGAGAWQDNGDAPNSGVGPTGWKHQTDIGLIRADHDMMVTLKPSVVSGTGFDIQNFGITVFTGMDTNTGNYSHHGAWNNASVGYTQNNPFGTQGLTYLKHDGTVDANNGLTFFAAANTVYSIYLGGAGVGRWNQNVADYSLAIETAPVPVPAAAWLFGGALMSLVGARRRKSVMPA